LRGSTTHSLRIARDRGLKTVAFPAVGTGIAGFPMQECAEIMLRATATHLQAEAFPETVFFVLFDEAGKNVFEQAWKKLKVEIAADAAGAKGA